jgi:hypothetical protein
MSELRWASRVSPEKIRKLYADESKNILEHDLLQEVGISFYARAESIIATNRIHLQSIVTCPVCHKDIARSDKNMYICECGWSISSEDAHLSYKGQQFIGPSIVEFAEKFISDWDKAANDANKQMMAIDFLIHRFHWEMTERPTRPVAVNYIDGTMTNVTQLILELAFSEDITKRKNYEDWIQNKELSAKIWGAE